MSEVNTGAIVAQMSEQAESQSEEQQLQSAEQAEQVQEQPKQPEPPKDDKFAAKFAALARKEKMLRESERQMQQQAEQIKQMQAEIEKARKETQSWADRFKKEPLKVMEEAGLSYEELSQIVLNEGNPTPELMIKRLKEEMESSYKKELEELKKQLQDKEEREAQDKYAQAENAFKAEIRKTIDTNDKYELTRANGAYDLVFDVIREYYEQNNRVLSHEEAADLVESHLEEEAKKVLELKKVKNLLGVDKPQPTKATQAAPTLSNTLSAEQPVKGSRKLSKEESLQEAAKLIRWE